jgi:transporter family-2 protein
MTIGRTLAVVLTVCAGALMATQSNVNGRLGRGVGTFQAATISFGVGLVVIVALTLLFGGGLGPIARAGSLPKWTLWAVRWARRSSRSAWSRSACWGPAA